MRSAALPARIGSRDLQHDECASELLGNCLSTLQTASAAPAACAAAGCPGRTRRQPEFDNRDVVEHQVSNKQC